MKNGNSKLYSFPFWLIVDSFNPPEPIVVKLPTGRLRIYPPFRSSPENFVWMPEINPHRIPFLGGMAPKLEAGVRLMTVGATPVLARDGNGPSIQFAWGAERKPDELPPRDLPMDSLRLDIYGHVDAEAFVEKFLRMLRWQTKQWWITRSVGGIYGYARNEFSVSPDGAPLELPTGLVRITTSGSHEVAITRAVWEQCAHQALADKRAPEHALQLMDARFLFTTKDMSMFIVNAANACESAKDLAIESAWNTSYPGQKFRRGKVLNGYDLTLHIQGPLKDLSGRSFAAEFPAAFAQLGYLWDARGSVAHGGTPNFRIKGKQVAVDNESAKLIIEAADVFIDWVDRLVTPPVDHRYKPHYERPSDGG